MTTGAMVVTAGGIVAKSVGPIGTMVVADPAASTPHEVSTSASTSHRERIATSLRFSGAQRREGDACH
ncbi:MAG: hypothetical protein EB005_02490 [Actinobacteria bacterium]|nr:hypothetical protein [Actinomycetota bacterium]